MTACTGGAEIHGSGTAEPPDAAVPNDAAPTPPDAPPTPPDGGRPDYPFSDLDEGCAPIFAQAYVPEIHLTIADAEWSTMQDEFLHPVLGSDGVLDPPYHPAQLHIVEGPNQYDPPDVMVRLNGNTSWLQTILYDANPKMQFLIAFNEIDSDARFEGLRKLKLDMPRGDWTFLQQRVASAWLRARADIPAPCANNARVFINGAYYGLYTNAERQDKSFLKRIYGGADDDGDLWKGGRVIKTNEDTFTWDHISAFWDVLDLPGLDALTDLDPSMREWASEAVIGDCDGYVNGRANFYLYDRPSNGRFVWLVNDLDTVLDGDFLPADTTPVLAPAPPSSPRHERDWYHYLLALNDPAGVDRFEHALALQLARLDPAEIATWVDAWAPQIEDAAEDDPHRIFEMEDHVEALAAMKSYAVARAAYLEDWLECRTDGGADGDGDGYDMCHDCNDGDAAQSPAAPEICDLVDNDCNGRVDDNLPDPDSCTASATREDATWMRVLWDPKGSRIGARRAW